MSVTEPTESNGLKEVGLARSLDSLQQAKIWQMKFARINTALTEARVEIVILREALAQERESKIQATKETREILCNLLNSHLN